MRVTWILEAEVFPETHSAMSNAVLATHNQLLLWRDEWLSTGQWPTLREEAVVFQGSLGNASTIRTRIPWQPGAFCNTQAFCCSSWYPLARQRLLHQHWTIVPASHLVTHQHKIAEDLGSPASVFVRPDSPLKPFSGRVLNVGSISLRALDHGFYYEEETLPVVVAPVRQIDHEWRYVVVNGEVVAGSAYDAGRRAALPDSPNGAAWRFADQIARELSPPDDVYVLDVCYADKTFHLLELNPFSGADLYACDRMAIVQAVSSVARSIFNMAQATPEIPQQSGCSTPGANQG